MGHKVTAWPHQISPNRARCLARVNARNLKGIKCKCSNHMPTSNRHRSLASHHLPPHQYVFIAQSFTCLPEWGAVKMTMVFSHTDQVQNIFIPAEGKTGNRKGIWYLLGIDLQSKFLMLSTKWLFCILIICISPQWHDAFLSNLLIY